MKKKDTKSKKDCHFVLQFTRAIQHYKTGQIMNKNSRQCFILWAITVHKIAKTTAYTYYHASKNRESHNYKRSSALWLEYMSKYNIYNLDWDTRILRLFYKLQIATLPELLIVPKRQIIKNVGKTALRTIQNKLNLELGMSEKNLIEFYSENVFLSDRHNRKNAVDIESQNDRIEYLQNTEAVLKSEIENLQNKILDLNVQLDHERTRQPEENKKLERLEKQISNRQKIVAITFVDDSVMGFPENLLITQLHDQITNKQIKFIEIIPVDWQLES